MLNTKLKSVWCSNESLKGHKKPLSLNEHLKLLYVVCQEGHVIKQYFNEIHTQAGQISSLKLCADRIRLTETCKIPHVLMFNKINS